MIGLTFGSLKALVSMDRDMVLRSEIMNCLRELLECSPVDRKTIWEFYFFPLLDSRISRLTEKR